MRPSTTTMNNTLLPLVNVTEGSKKPILKLSSEILNQIQYCHHRVGGDEWSGTLIYSFDDAKISISDFYKQDRKNDIRLTAKKFLLRRFSSNYSKV